MMNKNVKRNAALILTGLAVGVTAGVLMAPKSGRETRSDIRRGMQSGYQRAGSAWRKMRGRREFPADFVREQGGVLAGRC